MADRTDPPGDPVHPSRVRAIRRRLLTWYDHHRRDLPWRNRARDPYAQWVAEAMLQQTRVETVIPYYERFMRRFPTVEVLARAKEQTVLKHWEGLGYYRRILHLHRAARQVARSDGFPKTAANLRALPGIGEYMGAAIASIAFDEPVAAVDGNVSRVIARLFGVTDDVLRDDGKQRVRSIAQRLIPQDRPGDFNQAWMDLGSAICTPRAPQCPVCPLRNLCSAAGSGQADSLPVRRARNGQTPTVRLVVGILRCGGRVLVWRRPTGGLWSGLWEFPNIEWRSSSARRALATLAHDCGVSGRPAAQKVGEVRHQLTHRTMCFHVYVVNGAADDGEAGRSQRSRWVTPAQLARLSMSTAHRRVYAAASVADG